MSALSNDLETKLINHILRNTQHTTPGTSIYIALFTDDPGEDASGTEVTGGSYVREQCSSWDAPTDGATANTAAITFTQATASWGTVSHVAIFDAETVGNMLFYGALTASKAIDDGDTFEIPAGDLDVSLA